MPMMVKNIARELRECVCKREGVEAGTAITNEHSYRILELADEVEALRDRFIEVLADVINDQTEHPLL